MRKGASSDLLDELSSADAERRTLLSEVEELRGRQNAASKEIGQASPDERPAKIEAAAAIKEQLGSRESVLGELQAKVDDLVLHVPNPAHESVPDGGEDEGDVLAEVGERIDAPPMDHAEFGEKIGWVQNEKGASVSGSRFAYGARARADDDRRRLLPGRPPSGVFHA